MPSSRLELIDKRCTLFVDNADPADHHGSLRSNQPGGHRHHSKSGRSRAIYHRDHREHRGNATEARREVPRGAGGRQSKDNLQPHFSSVFSVSSVVQYDVAIRPPNSNRTKQRRLPTVARSNPRGTSGIVQARRDVERFVVVEEPDVAALCGRLALLGIDLRHLREWGRLRPRGLVDVPIDANDAVLPCSRSTWHWDGVSGAALREAVSALHLRVGNGNRQAEADDD